MSLSYPSKDNENRVLSSCPILSLEEDYDEQKQLHSYFTPVFFLYNLHKRSIHEQHIFSRLGMYVTKTAWFLSLDIKVADRGLDLRSF